MELDEIYAKDPWRWMCQQVITVDESATGELRYKRWPQHHSYLRNYLKILRNEQIVIVPKSRRMMITWATSADLLHSTRYQKGSANFILSEIETKAAFVVDKRCVFIEDHLRHPEFRREYIPLRTKTGLVGRMTYPEMGSYLWGLASTADAVRTYTASRVFVDEIEFIEAAPAVVRSVMPLVENGAQAIFVSSSNGPMGVIAEYCAQVGFSKWSDMIALEGDRIAYAS